MSHSEPARIAARRVRSAILVVLALAGATVIGVVTGQASFGRADGALPAGVSVFDERSPAVTNLDPDLLIALRKAAAAAARNKLAVVVKSGWRSPKYQRQLLHEAVSKYGSHQKAARWVATADTSPHVSGHAVDVGPARALTWLSRHGAKYGLCQIYKNEPWHYELRAGAVDDGCPSMYANPTLDPRMRQ
jgi:D-alanyl-D-alanine carboxypeptidase